ncbi:MAG TPA: STAS domain-containing protein [Terriglobales bacterium]|nr:STAS domain-containing protein [Terriglobales bacterium]
MTTGRAVVVKQFPNSVEDTEYATFFRELRSYLEGDRPYLVFDFTGVKNLDSVGVEFLLMCMEEAMKRNGDVKLASVSPQLGAILEMTRVDRLFEIFENCSDAAESFHHFSPNAVERMAPGYEEHRSRAEGGD